MLLSPFFIIFKYASYKVCFKGIKLLKIFGKLIFVKKFLSSTYLINILHFELYVSELK